MHRLLDQLENETFLNARAKLASYVLRELRRRPAGADGRRVQLAAPKKEIASQLGMAPETFSRAQADLSPADDCGFRPHHRGPRPCRTRSRDPRRQRRGLGTMPVCSPMRSKGDVGFCPQALGRDKPSSESGGPRLQRGLTRAVAAGRLAKKDRSDDNFCLPSGRYRRVLVLPARSPQRNQRSRASDQRVRPLRPR